MMENLPREIAFEIFYRLPPESVLRCKLSWRNLLPLGEDGNHFANMHLRRRRHYQHNLDYSTLNFISLREFRNNQEEEGSVVGEFYITEYDEVEGRLNCKVKRPLTLSQISIISTGRVVVSITTLVGSCNGLLCFTISCRWGGTNRYSKVIICNPLLHEYVTLPLSDLQYHTSMAIIGFGHNPITDEYKVVRVYYYSHSPRIGDVEVYTLGKRSSSNGAAGMWRSKGTIKHWLRSGSLPVVINESLHWLANTDHRGEYIVSFDLGDEEFRVIPLPSEYRVIPLPSDLNITVTLIEQLKELRGCLCLIGRPMCIFPWDLNRDIWVLKDYMNKESWVKEYSIKWDGGQPRLCYSPCAIIKKKKDDDDDGDEILCWCTKSTTKKTLVSYDPKTQKFEKVVVGGQDVDDGIDGFIFGSVLHINSLVSLKALGEDAKYG